MGIRQCGNDTYMCSRLTNNKKCSLIHNDEEIVGGEIRKKQERLVKPASPRKKTPRKRKSRNKDTDSVQDEVGRNMRTRSSQVNGSCLGGRERIIIHSQQYDVPTASQPSNLEFLKSPDSIEVADLTEEPKENSQKVVIDNSSEKPDYGDPPCVITDITDQSLLSFMESTCNEMEEKIKDEIKSKPTSLEESWLFAEEREEDERLSLIHI